MTSFYSPQELKKIGFQQCGENVSISRFAHFYSPHKIKIGNHVRIDDFCILSGEVTLGSYIHISAYNALYGANGIEMHDYSGLSPRCTLFSASDDFSGNSMVGPLIPDKYTNVYGGKIIIDKYVQIGAGSTILPAVHLHEGAASGAMSLITKSVDAWTIVAGVPAQKIKDRSKELLKKVSLFKGE